MAVINSKKLVKENVDYIIATDIAPRIDEPILGSRFEYEEPNFEDIKLWRSSRVNEIKFTNMEEHGIKGYFARTNNSIILVLVSESNGVYRKAAEKAFAAK